jgi:trimethylamine--corrinoid protein Co-methyltransferase
VKTAFEVLSQDERAQIHERTLHILATTGMRVDTPTGRNILREAGAAVDGSTGIVRFPPELVERSLDQARRELTLGGRRPGWSHRTGEGRTTLVEAGEAPLARDRVTGEIRLGVGDDRLQGIRLIDALDEIGVYWAMVSESGQDAGDLSFTLADEVEYMAAVQRGFSKHVQDSSENAAAMPWLLEILSAVFGGRDEVARQHPYSFLLTPISPLVIERRGTDACLALGGWDIPVAIMPMPMAGTTAPGSLAGTILQGNCEVIGTLCLLEAAEPGRPIIYAPIFATMNPRTGVVSGRAGHALGAACTEMANYYGLPSLTFGCDSDHFMPGMQAGYEKALSSLVPMLTRPDLLVGPGSLASAMVYSAEQTVIDCEIFRTCARICEGIAVEDQFLEEVIGAVGPGGNFLAEKSTRRAFHEGDFFTPDLGWHDTRKAWEMAGRPDLLDQARERVDQLLATHEVLPLGEGVERELRQLEKKAREA